MEEALYFNGDILTMEDELYVEAVLVKNGKIVKVGSKEDLIKLCSKYTKMINLDGKTLMPSFIDSHSHFTGYANSLLQISLEDANNFNDIIRIIKEFIKNNNVSHEVWIIAKGYDHNSLEEKIHPSKFVLDNASIYNPIVIQHKSGHMGVCNSKALKNLGVTKETKNPDGGVIGRIINTEEPDGYLEENAFISYIKEIPMVSIDEFTKAIVKAQDKYASYGITTMQEGFIIKPLVNILKLIKEGNLLKIDLVGYVDINDSENIMEQFESCIKKYENHFKIGGYKMFLDGSPQGRTAWMLEPYKNGEDGYKGYPIYKDEEVEEKIEVAINDNMQILVHCNGDAAVNQYITQYEIAKEKCNKENEIRPVIVHAQLLRRDQLDKIKSFNMMPSFFIAHVYHWGDVHINNFSKERADSISPANSSLKKDIKFTFHQDAPVIEPNMLETIWCAVNRITKDDVILGEEEKISPLEALKAITINAAFQYFEEGLKGSIKENKLADLVILDSNPLKVKKNDIRNIKVLETIKDGKTIFKYEV